MSRFPNVTYQLVLECGGNGRSFFEPEARGNQWTNGGVGCPQWTGVRLADVLKAAGLKSSAVYTGHYGADPTLAGETDKPTISRGMTIKKAMDEHTLIAFKLNGQDLPLIHGAPVRLIVPGWAGSLSTKWLNRIWVRDKEHDGPGMGGFSYRVPKTPIVPGSKGNEKDMAILESMPVRSVVTFPADGARLAAGTRKLDLRGQAWAGDWDIKTVDISIDAGKTWKSAKVNPPANKFAWQRFTASVDLPSSGYYEVLSRATDSNGVTQPFTATNWNPQGYGANPINRIRVLVELLRELTITHVVVITLTATFVLLGLDRAGELRAEPAGLRAAGQARGCGGARARSRQGQAAAAQRHARGPARRQGPRRHLLHLHRLPRRGADQGAGPDARSLGFDLRPDAGEAPHAAGEGGGTRRDPGLSRRAVPAAPSRPRRGQSVQIAFAHFSDQTCSGRNSRSSSSPSAVRR